MIRVLVVEDDKEIRALVKSSLEVEGFEVLTAVSLAEAQRIIANAKPELIILDLGLPDGDGAELVLSVRKEQNLPIIIISARDQEAQKIRLLDAGADDYLSKPFGVQELLARIRVALRHRGRSGHEANGGGQRGPACHRHLSSSHDCRGAGTSMPARSVVGSLPTPIAQDSRFEI